MCCAFAPCPLGMLISRRRRGRCRALAWRGDRYVCRALTEPQRLLPWLPQAVAPLLQRLVRRWIASGTGCDAHLESTP